MTTDHEREATLELKGHVVGDAAASQLTSRLRVLLSQGYETILVSVGELTYTDSVLLGAVVQAHTAAIRVGVRLRIVHATKRFRELLAVTKLDRVLDVVGEGQEGQQPKPLA